jgi:hypothetical protein
VTEKNQPRSDLDAAVDAVLPSLTAVSDDDAAASLRRTRIALAETRSSHGLSGWRWGLAAAAAAVIVLALALWHTKVPEPGSTADRRPANPAILAPPLASSAPPVAPAPIAPRRVAAAAAPAPRAERRRSVPVTATSAPRSSDTPPTRADPVLALARALEALPESAWNEAMARTSAPIGAAELSVAPIVVAPLVTPPIADAPPAPPVQGEP